MPPLSTPLSPGSRLLPYMGLIIAVLLAYANVYDNAFLFDDDLIITHNELLNNWSSLGTLMTSSTTEGAHIAGGFYRPVQLVLYFLINQGFGRSTFAFHALNIILHAANACLMCALGRRLKFNPTACFIASLIWAVYPLHTEAVTYMSATADCLFGFFSLLGCVLILPDASPRRIMVVLPVFLLGLLSKETMVIFPVFALLCLLMINAPKGDWKKLARSTWPLWVIAGVYMFWRVGDERFDGPLRYKHLYVLKDFATLKSYADHVEYRIYTFLATLPAYLNILVRPVDLHMERVFPIFTHANMVPVLEGALVAIAGCGQIIWSIFIQKGRRGAALSWGILWAAAAHFPNSGLVVPTNSLFLEHWLYVPTTGLFLGIAESIYGGWLSITTRFRTHESRFEACFAMTVLVLSLVLAGLLGMMTFQQNMVWQNPIAFYKHLFEHNEGSARAHNNLALAYAERGDLTQALDEFQKAIQITDTYAETQHNYALTLLSLPDQANHLDEAIAHLNRSLEIDPNFYRSLDALAAIYEHQGDHSRADDYHHRAAIAKARFSAP